MLVALDLTARQAARVLAEAVHKHAKLEIEPRVPFDGGPVWGVVTGRSRDTLSVDLLAPGVDLELLAGAMCDVRTILSRQLYLFSTVILEVGAHTAPARLTLASPPALQIANRRRHTRKVPGDPITVSFLAAGMSEPSLAPLANLSFSGLGCRIERRLADEHLLIGDAVRVEFALPWLNRSFDLPTAVCSKSADHDADHLLVGFEFCAADAFERATLAALREAVQRETHRLTELEGV